MGARATLDFFAAQASARRRTALLVVALAASWLGTVALVFVGLGALLATGVLQLPAELAFSAPLLAAVAGFVTVVTAGGSAFHAARLARGGGHAVARMVGGAPIDRATADPAERRLVNVVEEMAIASGVPVPALYVLPGEEGINAFAAGLSADDAVVAVTRGALEALGRDELQGVVAHEFSHLLNADARLNLRLVALVGGITVLALMGRFLVRGVAGGRRVRTSRGRGRSTLWLAGACLWLAGSVGAFFGRVVRAAVSRQREYLADAAAVQFTRNPDGLAGALAKIAERGSALVSAGAPEVSHLFFANGLASTWLATHPPIGERIRRVAPHFAGRLARAAVAEALAGAGAPGSAGEVTPARAAGLAAPGSAGEVTPARAAAPASAHALVASAGRTDAAHVAHAAGLLASLPPELTAAARSAAGARALVPALLVDADAAAARVQLRALAPGARAATEPLAAALSGASREDRIALLDLALPALDALPRDAAAALAAELAALTAADGRTTLFEWAVARIVRRRLARALGEARPRPVRARALADVEVEALELLSVVAWLGAREEAGARAALEAGAAVLGVRGWRPLPRDRVRAARLEASLARLDGAVPALKARLLEACAAAALADGRVAPAEGEVIRAVAASLGVPLPPLLAAPRARAAGAG